MCNMEGTQYNHLTVYVNAKIPRVPEYKVEEYEYIKQMPEGDEKMRNFIKEKHWMTLVGRAATADEMVRIFPCGPNGRHEGLL